METSAESYLSNVVNGSVTMMAEAWGQARRRRRPASPPGGEKPFESNGFEVEMPAIPAASRSTPPGAAAGDAVPACGARANRRSTSSIWRARPTAIAALQQELLALFDKQSASLLAPVVRPFGRAAPARRRRPPAQGLGAGGRRRRGRARRRRGRDGARPRSADRPRGGRTRARGAGGGGRGGARRDRRAARLSLPPRRFGAPPVDAACVFALPLRRRGAL